MSADLRPAVSVRIQVVDGPDGIGYLSDREKTGDSRHVVAYITYSVKETAPNGARREFVLQEIHVLRIVTVREQTDLSGIVSLLDIRCRINELLDAERAQPETVRKIA